MSGFIWCVCVTVSAWLCVCVCVCVGNAFWLSACWPCTGWCFLIGTFVCNMNNCLIRSWDAVFVFFFFPVVTITSGLISYPIDTVRRRMMMTSGEAVKYKGSLDCAVQVVKSEGFMALMKGAGKHTCLCSSQWLFLLSALLQPRHV